MNTLRGRFTAFFVVLAFAFVTLGCGGQSPENANGQESNPAGNPNIDAPVFDFQQTVENNDIERAGFDLDDTLLFSSPAFNRGFNQAEEAFSPEFWRIVNSSDEGRSCEKPKMVELLEKHRERGHEIYVITARERYNSEVLQNHVSERFDIPADHVYLEPNGKTERLQELGIDIYYGDSDSDITEARDANIKAVRVLRSPESGYDAKHNPGKYDEPYVANSAPPHGCSDE
jgi:acid phosphatase (class B)